jgi:hypothetical protein
MPAGNTPILGAESRVSQDNRLVTMSRFVGSNLRTEINSRWIAGKPDSGNVA